MKTDLSTTKMLFYGTPEISVPTLNFLFSNYSVVACVTQPDKPAGRGKSIQASPVKQFAEANNIPVLQPTSVSQKTPDGTAFADTIRTLAPDVAIVFAYGHIIPGSVLAIPRMGSLNIHTSLLPLLRGASPIQSAIRDGCTETGITLMKMGVGMDTGPILATVTVPITNKETAETLHDTLQAESPKLLQRALPQYLNGDIEPEEQDESRATYCTLIKKEDGEINWNQSPIEIDRLVRAYTPWPGAYTYCNDTRVKIIETTITSNGTLQIIYVQPAGKNKMDFTSFTRGYPQCPLPPR